MIIIITPSLRQFCGVYNEFYKGHGKNVNIHAIRRFFRKCKLIVVRRTMNNSKPCNNCVQKIKFYGIGKIYYSYDQKIVYENSTRLCNDYISPRYKFTYSEKDKKQKIKNKR